MLEFDEQKHIYTIDGVQAPSVTQVLQDLGIINPDWFTEESRIRGTYVHKACQLHCEGKKLAPLDGKLQPYFDAFLSFMDQTDFTPNYIEHRVYSKNPPYAGTLDLAGMLNKSFCVIDIKTGNAPKWAALQTKAYSMCLKRLATTKRFTLQLSNNGKYKLKEHKNEFEDYNDWNSLLNSWYIKKEYSR